MKNTKTIIGEYLERNDVNGLAAFFRAYLEDEMEEREKLRMKIEGIPDTLPQLQSDEYDKGLADMKKKILKLI